MTAQTYASPQAFKQALEQRLRTSSNSGVDFTRKRQLLVFDRFLARVVAVMGDPVLLKGRRDLGDFMTFEVVRDTEHPTIQNDGMQYEGLRFRAECRLAGKLYGQCFGVDVAFGDPILGEPETVTVEDALAFAGIAPPVVTLYPIETHIAEKLHAYTMPRPRPNTRVKDLPDIALLATIQPLAADRLRKALEQTFEFRATHPLPSASPNPPANWLMPYTEMAESNDLAWKSLEQLTAAARAFLNPVLAGNGGVWRPNAWTWKLSQAPPQAPDPPSSELTNSI